MVESVAARELLEKYEEAMAKVGPTVRGAVEKDAAVMGLELEGRLRDLAEGYTRLNQLALEAPLGLASAAAQHHARLGSFGLSEEAACPVSTWDEERHRDVLWETREALRLLDARFGKLPGAKTARAARLRLPGAKFSSDVRPPVFERRAKPESTSPVKLCRYRGGFHGEPIEGKPQAAPPEKKKKKPKAQPTRVVVKERNYADVLAVAKASLGAAVSSANRAVGSWGEALGSETTQAAAAESAARTAALSRPREPVEPVQPVEPVEPIEPAEPVESMTAVVVDQPAAEYRVMAPRRVPAAERVFQQTTARPIETLDRDLYLASPGDASDCTQPTTGPLPRRAAPCIEPGLAPLETERVIAVANAPPLWIPQGKRKPLKPRVTGGKAKVRPSPLPPSVPPTDLPREAFDDPDQRDCARLVARFMLARDRLSAAPPNPPVEETGTGES